MKLFCILLSAVLNLTSFGSHSNVYTYKNWDDGPYGRFNDLAPIYVIYPNHKVDSCAAADLIVEMGLNELVDEYDGKVFVVNPIGEEYDTKTDTEFYPVLMSDIHWIANLKIITIGRGADFFNCNLASRTGNASGILSIDGSRKGERLLQKNAKAPILLAHTSKDKSLRDILSVGWTDLFSLQYRYSNVGHTWYTGDNFEQYPYEFVPYVMFDRMHLKRNVVEEDITTRGEKYLWYEYLPEEFGSMSNVPLVILLHGHGNDPRTQAESSGFLSIAQRERIAVVEAEWQGIYRPEYKRMGIEGLDDLVNHLLKKYPQLDATRVYAEGLSAGAITATTLGVRKSHIFAAVGAQCAGVWDGGFFGADANSLLQEAKQKRGKVETAYFSIAGLKDEVVPFYNSQNWEDNSFFRAYQLYQTLNDFKVDNNVDMTIDTIFGIELDNRETIITKNGHTFHVGEIRKGEVPLIKVMAIENFGHWNSVEASEMMWEFFKHYSRDLESGKLIYNK